MLPALEGLDYPEVGRLIIAALKYARDGEQPASLKGKETVLWPVFMSQIDRNRESYKIRCEINRNNRLSKTIRHATAKRRRSKLMSMTRLISTGTSSANMCGSMPQN